MDIHVSNYCCTRGHKLIDPFISVHRWEIIKMLLCMRKSGWQLVSLTSFSLLLLCSKGGWVPNSDTERNNWSN